MTEPREPSIDRELSQRVPGPDLTGRVMRRLGYAAAQGALARSRRRRRRIARVLAGAAVLTFCGLGVWLHYRAAAPAHPTIPSAIRHDLEQHRRTIGRAIRTIRELPPEFPPEFPPDAPGDPGAAPS